jgi:hypothetical protein
MFSSRRAVRRSMDHWSWLWNRVYTPPAAVNLPWVLVRSCLVRVAHVTSQKRHCRGFFATLLLQSVPSHRSFRLVRTNSPLAYRRT